jgi:RND family efflux transporter MFP subunit
MTDLSKLRIEREPEEKVRPSRIGKMVAGLLTLLLVAAGAYFLLSGPLKPATEVKITIVTAVYPGQASSVLNASGYVVAQRKADVASKGTGKLELLAVEEGTVVKKGQMIGRLESKDMEAALAQAKADLEVAKASLVEAKANFERRRTLAAQELISKDEHDLSEAQHKRAIANVAAAQAKVRAAQVDVENTYIRAPFDGTVLTKSADVGEIVAPFGSAGNSKGAVVSMADMDSLQVEADVSESNIERVSVGQPCEITLDAFPEKRYRAQVHMIVPTADRAKATVMTKVRFLDKDERVLPEMSAKVAFLTKEMSREETEAKPKITVDPDAVVTRHNKKVVFLVRENQAVEASVTTGDPIGAAVEILQGLSAGDQVSLKPPSDLRSGSKVKVVS